MDGGNNRYERLTRTSPSNANDVWRIEDIRYSNGVLRLEYLRLADVGFQWLIRTNVADSAWQHLDVPGNEIRYASSNANVDFTFSVTNWPDAFFRLNLFDL